MSTLQFKRIKGKEIEAYINDIAALRIKIFHDYPYLYEGNAQYEKNYLKIYSDCPHSIVILVLDENKVVGASTALPLSSETGEVKAPFLTQGIDIDSVFYLGESVLLPSYRGQKIGERFFAEREAAAREQHCKTTVFCAVERPEDHPRRPQGWHPLDKFWQRLGYKKHPELHTFFSWKERDEREETLKPMVFWMKNL